MEGDWKEAAANAPAGSDIRQILSLFLSLKGKSSGFLKNLLATFPGVSAGLESSLEDFEQFTSLLDTLGVDYLIDITSGPGFEYYSGPCFQFWLGDKKVGGGGRYDDLVPLMGGGKVPACGFALYMDPLMGMFPQKGGKRAGQGVLVRGSSTAPGVVKLCFELAKSLRNAGYVAELDFSGKEKSDWRWVIAVDKEGQPFTVTDQTSNRKKPAASVPEAVNMVGAGR
jgi:histidyl-tRNA synthetase